MRKFRGGELEIVPEGDLVSFHVKHKEGLDVTFLLSENEAAQVVYHIMCSITVIKENENDRTPVQHLH